MSLHFLYGDLTKQLAEQTARPGVCLGGWVRTNKLQTHIQLATVAWGTPSPATSILSAHLFLQLAGLYTFKNTMQNAAKLWNHISILSKRAFLVFRFSEDLFQYIYTVLQHCLFPITLKCRKYISQIFFCCDFPLHLHSFCYS